LALLGLELLGWICLLFLISNQGRDCGGDGWVDRSKGQGMSMWWFLKNDWLVKRPERTINRQG
jgi:hypothetical protein